MPLKGIKLSIAAAYLTLYAFPFRIKGASPPIID